MAKGLTLRVTGVKGEPKNNLFKFFISQKWGFISNLEINGNVSFVNLVNWEDKFPTDDDELSLCYRDKVLTVTKIDWAPRRRWSTEQFSFLTSFVEVGR